MAQRAEVIIYAISTDDSGLVMRGDKVLEQFAEATGGRAFFPFKMKDITHSFAAIEDELRSQYVVSYKPAILMLTGATARSKSPRSRKTCRCAPAKDTSRRSSSSNALSRLSDLESPTHQIPSPFPVKLLLQNAKRGQWSAFARRLRSVLPSH